MSTSLYLFSSGKIALINFFCSRILLHPFLGKICQYNGKALCCQLRQMKNIFQSRHCVLSIATIKSFCLLNWVLEMYLIRGNHNFLILRACNFKNLWMARLLLSNVMGMAWLLPAIQCLLVYVLAAEKLKFAELSIPLFLVVFGNNFGKMEVTFYIDGVAYKNWPHLFLP